MLRVIRNIFFLLFIINNFQNSYTQDVLSFINSKKVKNVIDDRYISIVVDPMILLNGISTRLQSLGIAKHLSPAFVRISSSFDDTSDVNKADKLMKLTVHQAMWTPLNRWLISANFTPVFKLSDRERVNDAWDPKSAMSLMQEVDKMKISVVWEIDSGLPNKTLEQYSSDAATLRHVVSVFPASRNSWSVAGGELSRCTLPAANSEAQRLELTQKYLKIVEENVDAVSWTPNSSNEINFPMKIMKTAPATHNPAIWTTAPRTSIPTNFKDALIWAKYLGQAANYGYNVIFRQPKIAELQMMTPSFWVSIIHKMLIGNEVLDIYNMNPMNKTDCYVFAHSTKNEIFSENKESVTIFAVNLEETESNISAKFFERSVKGKEFHSYILTEENENSSEIRLNGDLLTISDLQDQKIKFKPKICRAKSSNSVYLNLPAKSIGFFVIPLSFSVSPQENKKSLLELETDTTRTSMSNSQEIINEKYSSGNRLTLEKQHDSDSEMNKSNNAAEKDESAIFLQDDITKLIIKNATQGKKQSALHREQKTIDLKKLLTGSSSTASADESKLNSEDSQQKYEMGNKNQDKQSARKKRQVNSLETPNIELETQVGKTRSSQENSDAGKDLNEAGLRTIIVENEKNYKSPSNNVEDIKTYHKQIKNQASINPASHSRAGNPLKEMDDKSTERHDTRNKFTESKDIHKENSISKYTMKRKLASDVLNENKGSKQFREYKHSERVKRLSEKIKNGIEVQDIPDEIKIELLRQQLEHKKHVDEQLNNFHAFLEDDEDQTEGPNKENKIYSNLPPFISTIASFKRFADWPTKKYVKYYIRNLSSDSVDKTSDDNRTTKFNKIKKRSIDDDKTKEIDTFLNEISTEDKFPHVKHIQEDIYLIKPETHHDTTTQSTMATTLKENESSTHAENDESSSEEYYDTMDLEPSSSHIPEKEGLVDNVFQTMFYFLRDFHKKIVDYLHYLSR